MSGTNLDDLGDYRPGLEAARDHQVRHPFVEAEIDKRTVRALAAELGLGVLSELPSAPCLSSRVETGIRIEAAVLAMVHEAEKLVGARLSPKTVRCRVRGNAVVIELDEGALVPQPIDASGVTGGIAGPCGHGGATEADRLRALYDRQCVPA